ncbi:MAG: hypothetical protein DRJ29_13630 [Bacteroidetes bacterium]|nr:MAG: hypothetical protein DRJ29_13630 [Bacteroidota bacterium]
MRNFLWKARTICLLQPLSRKPGKVYFEVHSNPTIDVVDVAGALELAHNGGALVIVDNTFLTPYLIQPLALGADIVIHSATKYMMGHGNGMVGISCGPEKLLKPVKSIRKYVGGIMAPFNAFLLHPGYEVAKKQVKGFGGMMGIELAGDRKLTSLETIREKTSLGDVSSLLVTGFIEQERRGIPANYYRMSVGIEDSEDIISDLKQTLDNI